LDKFGIFNLLNSFLQSSGNSIGQNNDQSGDALSSFLSAFSNAENEKSAVKDNAQTAEKPQNSQASTQEKSTQSPYRLSAPLLSAMRTHDEFIKRVKKSNQQKTH
jgi:hypothetical protein